MTVSDQTGEQQGDPPVGGGFSHPGGGRTVHSTVEQATRSPDESERRGPGALRRVSRRGPDALRRVSRRGPGALRRPTRS